VSERPLYLPGAEIAKRVLDEDQASQWPQIAAVPEQDSGPSAGLCSLPVGAENIQKPRGQHRVPVAVALRSLAAR
jgi:hypothetical protein